MPPRRRTKDLEQQLGDNGIDAVRRDAEKSWYKFEKPGEEILVRRSTGLGGPRSEPMSMCSPVVSKLQAVRQSRLYVPREQRQTAEAHIAKYEQRGEEK